VRDQSISNPDPVLFYSAKILSKSESFELSKILEGYPEEFRRHCIVDGTSDFGEHMRYLGTVPRFFNPKESDFEDPYVRDYIISRGEDPQKYRSYAVVPKRLEDSYKSTLRYNRSEDPFSDETKKQYIIAFDWLEREFSPFLSGSTFMFYDEVLEWLNPKKSAGFPWTQLYPYKGDVWMSDHRGEYVKYWDCLATQTPIHSLCSISIKVEVRPVNKLPRTTISMDTHHVQAHLQMYGKQNQMLVDSVGQHSSCVGLNLLSGGADLLVARMSCFGPKSVMEIDGDKFDSRKRRFQIELLEQFRFNMLDVKYRTMENRQRSKNLYEEIISAPVVMPDGHVFSRKVGNTSGQGCTTPDNTFMNYTDIAVLYQKLVPKEYHSYDSWKKFVRLILCGDDLDVAVDECLRPFFNPVNILRVADEIGMVYTFGSMDFRDFDECSFIGHTYAKTEIPGLPFEMYLPCIDCDRMRSSMLVDNKEQTLCMTVIRACGLRVETFGCPSCREWFSSLINYLRVKTAKDYSEEMLEAWKNYHPDASLWKLYTGRFCDGSRKFAQSLEEPVDPSQNLSFLSLYPYLCTYLVFILLLSFVLSFVMPPKLGLSKGQKKRLKKKAKKSIVKAVVTNKIAGKGAYRPMTRGRGGYFSDIADKVVDVGGKVVKGIGSVFDTGHDILKLIGLGSYKTRAQAYNKHYKSQASKGVKGDDLLRSMLEIQNPEAMAMGEELKFSGGEMPTVSHVEFIGDVIGSDVFQTTSYRIQPGIPGLFPWGNSVAQCFQQYDLLGMIAEYREQSTPYTTSGTLGTVMMSNSYDVNLPPLADTLTVLNNDYTTSEAQTVSFIHPVECAPSKSVTEMKFIRTLNNSDLALEDFRLNDVGLFQVSVEGCPAEAVGKPIGKLYVSYKIRFHKPSLPDAHAGTTALLSWGVSSDGVATAVTANSNNSLAASVEVSGSGGVAMVNLPPNIPGNFSITLICSFNAPYATSNNYFTIVGVGSDVSPLNILDTYTPLGGVPPQATTYGQNFSDPVTTNGQSMITFTINTLAVSAANNYVTFSTPGHNVSGYTTPFLYTVLILPIANDITTLTTLSRKVMSKKIT